MPLYLGNKLMSEEYLGSTDVSLEFKFPPIDIVRDGLVFAFDWTSFNGDGTLTDRSVNNYDATYSGSLTVSNSNLQFDGTSSYISFNINANAMYNSWEWTVDTYGVINDIDTVTQYGQFIAYNSTPLNTVPAWSFGIQTSGSTTADLRFLNALVTTKDAPITASLTIPHQFTSIGRQGSNTLYPILSEVTLSMDTNILSGSGTGYNPFIGRSFNGQNTIPGVETTGSLQYFGGPEFTYNSPFGPITFNVLSGSIKYIAYYNRDLTDTEITQNNEFYLSGNPIP